MKKDRFVKIALLGVVLLGLSGCSVYYKNSYNSEYLSYLTPDTANIVVESLPAQKLAIPVESESKANRLASRLLESPNIESATPVEKDGEFYVIVRTRGIHTELLDILEEESSEELTAEEEKQAELKAQVKEIFEEYLAENASKSDAEETSNSDKSSD